MEIIFELPEFLSPLDEQRFFDALTSNPATISISGLGTGIALNLDKRKISKAVLLEYIAILFRYGTDLSPLSTLAEQSRHAWIKNEDYFWHNSMFQKKPE